MKPMGIEINETMQYVFLRMIEDEATEILTFNSTNDSFLRWIKYDDSHECKVIVKGKSIADSVAREITEEIVICRAKGYMVTIIEVPLDYETNPESHSQEYRLLPIGKKR